MALNNVLKKSTVKLLEHTESTVKIVVHVIFWTAFVGRCSKSNLKPDGTILVVMERLMTCAKGFAIMIATSFEKIWRKVVRSSGLFTLKFFQLDEYLRDSDGYQFKSKFGFRFGLEVVFVFVESTK